MQTRRCIWAAGLLLVLGSVTITILVSGHHMTNDHYTINKHVISSGGGRLESATYRNNGTIGQSSPLGHGRDAIRVNFGGFWGGSLHQYLLTVKKIGRGNGTVTGEGINCGPDCAQLYPPGTVNLSAAADTCSEVGRWLINEQEVNEHIPLEDDVVVTVEFLNRCPSTVLFFYDGFDAETAALVRDSTILPLARGEMADTDEILLPDIFDPFDFPAPVQFHLEYRKSAAGPLYVVPEATIPAVVLDKPFVEVTAGDIAGLSLWPEGRHLTRQETLIVQSAGGRYFKIGNMQPDRDPWTIFMNHEELVSSP